MADRLSLFLWRTKKMYLIAEIGFNHEGDIELAKEMILAAADAGADAAKFQTFKADDIALPSSPHYSLIKKGELSLNDHADLFQTAQKAKIDFLSTPFSKTGIDILQKIGVSAFKTASMDCTNKPLLKQIAKTGKPVYLSTGMADLPEIAESLRYLIENKSGKVSILHCISHYPAKTSDLNLEIIPYLKKLFNVSVGYSDHYPGIEACFAAAILGAEVVETHFTLDKATPGGDHSHSADPDDLKELKRRVHLFEEMKGSKDALYSRPDRNCAKDFRRGVYALKDLNRGDIISETDLFCTRPVSEFTPDDIKKLTGKTVTKHIPTNNPISKDFIA